MGGGCATVEDGADGGAGAGCCDDGVVAKGFAGGTIGGGVASRESESGDATSWNGGTDSLSDRPLL